MIKREMPLGIELDARGKAGMVLADCCMALVADQRNEWLQEILSHSSCPLVSIRNIPKLHRK
jgi:hypothetical protein